MSGSPPRLPDWPARLGALVAARLPEPFAWGPNDCAAFAADCVQAMTGADVLAPLRGPRATELQARKLLRRLGGWDVVTRCGLPEVEPALAGRGDLVLLRQSARPVLALCVDGEVAISPGLYGLARASMRCALRAWRV